MKQEETIVTGMTGRYASALFGLAKESGKADAVQADLERFARLMAESADMQRFVKSPVLSSEDQVKALKVLLPKAGIAGVASNFLQLLASKRRLFAVEAITADYGRLNDGAKGVARAEVTVAAPLNEQHVEALKQELHVITGGKSVDVKIKVDPSIIGGLIVKLGSRMVDGSLKTKLNSIRTRMKEVG